jgi:hypothetical protein
MTVLLRTPVITSIRLRGLDVVNLPFTPYSTDSDPYVVKNIDGIDPPDQTVAIAKTGSGGKFQGIQSEDRDVVALIMLHGDVKNLRNNLYTMLRTGYDPKVWIDLMAGGVLFATVEAYCSKFESALFVKEPAVQLTFRTLHDKFREPATTSYPATALSETNPNVYNPGTADTGFQFAVKFTDTMQHWYLRVAEDDSIGMTFDKAFAVGDILAVSTIPGKRYIHWNKKQGTVQNKMGILRADSEWITLHPGYNHFKVPPGTTKWQWKGPLTFTAQYWGV